MAALIAAGLVGGAVGGVTASHESAQPASVVASSASVDRSATATGVDVSAVSAKGLPSVVEIAVQSKSGGAIGSGVVIDANGDILTNAHVVEAAAGKQVSIETKASDGHTSTATVVGVDESADLAVIRAQDTTGLTAATFADSDHVTVGEPVVAIGAPAGLEDTVTSGIVSYVGREVTASGEGGSGSVTYHAIQTDAAINPGNSGGPLINADGDVIGINSVIYSPSTSADTAGSVGIGFAIPSNQAAQIAQQLISSAAG